MHKVQFNLNTVEGLLYLTERLGDIPEQLSSLRAWSAYDFLVRLQVEPNQLDVC